MQQQRNVITFIVLASLLLFGWLELSKYIWPPPAKPTAKSTEAASKDADKKDQGKKDNKDGKGDNKPVVRVPKPLPVTRQKDLLTLGDDSEDSYFHLRVLLDPRGAGVRSVLLNKFQAANELGQAEEGKRLELVPDAFNRELPSFLLYHFDSHDSAEERPVDTLGRELWQVDGGVKKDHLEDGRQRQQVSFHAEVDGVVVTKTYTLTEGEYHLGLEVKLARKSGEKAVDFRYQLTGAHGLPVEGKWYTGTFRNALIGRVDDRGSVWRDLQDLRQLSQWQGGSKVSKEKDRFIRYAAVAVQYFASALVVDDEQTDQNFLSRVRPTLETALRKGTIKSIADDRSSFVLKSEQGEETFLVTEMDRGLFGVLRPGSKLAFLSQSAGYDEKAKECPHVFSGMVPYDKAHALWNDDITVRVATDPVRLEPGKEVSHRYLLYHGPVKVALLAGQKDVSPELVSRYHDTLHLNTLTDYQSPGMMGSFAAFIHWTNLIIFFTNLMHTVLDWLYRIFGNYGVCILVLTVLVRALMFPLSRKQALTSIRMQQLAPELKKLQEKYKDDRQALGMAQMDLYRKHGVNPFGTCWVILIQMPIFMGLYYALQESIHFRLAPFWPTWIKNLAAPDMLIPWGESIPWISRPEDYGGFLYLGPYFNLLPVIAVVLMIFQQKMMTPPPADEQQAMQMKIMRYMTVVIGLAFYKVAAGLCVYFIASSLWGFAERRLLPRRQLAPAGGPPVDSPSEEGGFLQRLRNRASEKLTDNGITSAPDTRFRKGGRPGRGKRERDRARVQRENTPPGFWQRMRNWWERVLEEARKK
jgi:YidC/Oxa1 family membrane protein insertase